MKYRIALPAAAATAALILAPAMASAAQRPGPPSQGSVTYSQSCSRDQCSAKVTATGPLSLRHQQPYRFVTQDPRRESYVVSFCTTDYRLVNGRWKEIAGGCGDGGPYHFARSFAEDLYNPGFSARVVITATSTAVTPAGYPAPRLKPIPVIVEGLNPVR